MREQVGADRDGPTCRPAWRAHSGPIGTSHNVQQSKHSSCGYAGVPICQSLQLVCWAYSLAPPAALMAVNVHLQLVMLHLLHDCACKALHCICSVPGCSNGV